MPALPPPDEEPPLPLLRPPVPLLLRPPVDVVAVRQSQVVFPLNVDFKQVQVVSPNVHFSEPLAGSVHASLSSGASIGQPVEPPVELELRPPVAVFELLPPVLLRPPLPPVGVGVAVTVGTGRVPPVGNGSPPGSMSGCSGGPQDDAAPKAPTTAKKPKFSGRMTMP